MEIEDKEIKILFTALKILYPKYHPFWFIFYMYIWYLRTIKRQLKCNVQPVSIDFITKNINGKHLFKDLNHTVVVHPENIYLSDKVLKLYCDKSKNFTIVYPIADSRCKKKELLVSDTFYLNLLNLNLINNLRLLNYNINCLKFADEINISLVSSPFDINNSLSDSIIERFFKTPKLVRRGDLIEINIKYSAEEIYYLNSKINNVHSVFYKCNKVIYKDEEVTGTFCCVIGETAVKQGINIQTFLPKKTMKFIPKNDEFFKQLPIVPYGLQTYFEDIQIAAKPFLRKGEPFFY